MFSDKIGDKFVTKFGYIHRHMYFRLSNLANGINVHSSEVVGVYSRKMVPLKTWIVNKIFQKILPTSGTPSPSSSAWGRRGLTE